MKQYRADISIRRIGVTTAPKIPWDHLAVRFFRTLHDKVFKAADITQARQSAIDFVENPNLPEFQKVLDFYFVPHKTLEWGDWSDPMQPEGETQIHSCSSQPFLVGVFQWIVIVLVYEV